MTSIPYVNPVDRVLPLLDGVKGAGRGKWIARCPAHDDRDPSLSIREGDDGRVLIHCFTGCSVPDIVAALGLQMGDLFAQSTPASPTSWPRPSSATKPKRTEISRSIETI